MNTRRTTFAAAATLVAAGAFALLPTAAGAASTDEPTPVPGMQRMHEQMTAPSR